MTIDRTSEIRSAIIAWKYLPNFDDLIQVVNEYVDGVVDSYRDPRQVTPQGHLKKILEAGVTNENFKGNGKKKT